MAGLAPLRLCCCCLRLMPWPAGLDCKGLLPRAALPRLAWRARPTPPPPPPPPPPRRPPRRAGVWVATPPDCTDVERQNTSLGYAALAAAALGASLQNLAVSSSGAVWCTTG